MKNMQDDFAFLPHTLSFHQMVSDPLTGLDADILAEPLFQKHPIDKALAALMVRPAPERLLLRLQQHLQRHPDAWCQPEPISWSAWLDTPEHPELSGAEWRCFTIFEQLLREKRKSSKYLQAFERLCDYYPEHEALQQMRLNYYLAWEPLERCRAEMQTLLEAHPGWLFVRLMLARTYLQEDLIDITGFCTSLNQRLNLHEHLENLETPLTELLVYQFHLDLFLFFSLQGHLERAAWCYHTCSRAVSDPEILISLAPFILSGLEPDQLQPGLRKLLRLLR